jgi:hypothetical protein
MLRSKHSGWTWEGRRTPFVGGGGGGGTTQSTGTTYQTNIPEYARPYVETMLGATQKQLFTTRDVGATPETQTRIGTDDAGNPIYQTTPAKEGRTEITGFQPYKPYSENVQDYVAGMSPLQQQALQATGQLQLPGQIGAGSNLVGTAGQGALGAHGYGQQLGQQSLGYGGAAAGMSGMGFGAGQRFEQMATSPGAQAAYMSPYMQNVVDYQKMQALRDYNIGSQMRNAQAAKSGAFGGSRQAVVEAEAQRALGSQLQGITAQGSQKAFEDAQRQMQFGSQLGLQGLQAGYQGLGMGLQGVQGAVGAGQYGLQGLQQAAQAGTALGQLGAQQLAAQKDILGTQYSMGAQQQAMEQQKINQAIQDWSNRQQYPLMQLGVMSNMIRGLPMQSATTNQYVAAPNALTQGIGTVGAIGSLANVFRGKKGGLPSEFEPSKGIKSYNIGGAIKGKLYDMSPEDLREYINETSSPIAKQLAEEVLRDKVGKASGGIIAFKDRGEVEDPEMVRQAYIDAAKMKAAADKADIDAENERLLGRSPAPTTLPAPPPAMPSAPSGVRVGRAGVPVKVEDSPRMKAARAAETVKGYVPSADEAASFAEQERNLAASRAAAPLPGRGLTTVPGTTTVTNVPQGPAPAPSAAAAAPSVAPAPAGITAATATKTGNPELDKYIAATLAEANKPEKTVAELAAERRAYIGPDEFTPKERARLMAEKANAKEEATRQNWMRMAEFFATWGSTPGNSIVAGLTALKSKVPDFISDNKEQKKILKDINASITGLDKAERLERAGEFDKATELKQKLSADLKGKVGNVLTFAASNLSSQRSLEAAKVRAETTGGAGGENKLLAKVEADIGREKKAPAYERAFKWSNMPVTKDTSPEMKNRIEAEKANLQKFEDDFERRREQARKGGGAATTTTASTPAPGGKLVQNKDGTLTYQP